MHLIVFTHRLATPRSLTVSARHVALAVALSLAVMVTGAALLYYITFRYAANLKLPVLQNLVAAARADDSRKNDEFLRQNLKKVYQRWSWLCTSQFEESSLCGFHQLNPQPFLGNGDFYLVLQLIQGVKMVN